MDITRLPPGAKADPDSDCILIERTRDGRYSLVTSALVECDDEEEGDSEAVISGDTYDSYAEAEAAGLAWAEGLCVAHVFVETSG